MFVFGQQRHHAVQHCSLPTRLL